MKSAILHIRWVAREAQRFVFANTEDAIASVLVMCQKFSAAPEGEDWQDVLRAGGYVRTGLFTIQVEESDFHPTAMTTDEPLPEPVPRAGSKPDPLCKYVLMRSDVPQYLVGRAAAQSNHAGTAFVMRALRKNNPDLMNEITEWAEEGDGFGTTIVKTVTAAEMRQAVSLANLMGLYSEIINDPEYFIKDGEKVHFIPVDTCAFVFGRVSQCKPVVGVFPLMKGPGE